jgi:flagellar motor switch protein FliM
LNQILSQDEVDALLKGLETGEVEGDREPAEREGDYQACDWNAQGRNLKGNLPLFGLVNSRIAQALRSTLSGSLRKLVDVDPGQLEIIKFEEFQRSLPVPTSLHLFRMTPLRGMGLMVIESRLVFNLVEAYFGGSGVGSTKVEGRDFTPIEKRIIDKVVSMAMTNMREAWEEVFPIKAEFVRSESNPLAINVVPPSEFLLCVKFEVELNKSAGSITICIPYSAIQPIREKLAGTYQVEEVETDRVWINAVMDHLQDTEVEMSVDLGKTFLSVRELLNMKEGDILVLQKAVQGRLTAKVEGIPKFEGFAGKSRSKKVFRVENMISNS